MRISNSSVSMLLVFSVFFFINSFSLLSPIRSFFKKRTSHKVVSTTLNLAAAPFVSGEFFRSIADLVLNDTKKLEAFRTKQNATVLPGDIVFVKTDYMGTVTLLEARSRGPFVLITHDSAMKAPAGLRHRLKNDKLAYWYSQNKDYQHPKMRSVPLGIANSRWPHGNQTKILEFRKIMKPFNERSINVLVNFSNKTNPARKKTFAHFCDATSKIKSTCKSIMKSQDEYYSILGNTKFVISPPGKGMDCHRTWESVTLGAIPIVLNNSIAEVYEGERILVVNSFEEVTPELLKKAEEQLGKMVKTEGNSKIYRKYWLRHFQEIRDEVLERHWLSSSTYTKQKNVFRIILTFFVMFLIF